jgi:hypothetical protein
MAMAMDMDIEMDLDINPADNYTAQEPGNFVGALLYYLNRMQSGISFLLLTGPR